MDLRQLRYAIALADEGHFGRAAARLHIVPSALSMQMRQLEEELGGRLFHRGTRHVTPTGAGHALLAGARALVAEADTLRQRVTRQLRGELGTLRIGFSGGRGVADEMTRQVRRFHELYPHVEVVLREMGPPDQYEALRLRQLDLGYTARLHALPEHLQVHRCWSAAWHVLMAADHPLAQHEVIAPQLLAKHTLVTYDGQPTAAQDQAPQQFLQALLPRVVRTNSVIAVLAHVAAGLGYTLVPGNDTQALMPALTSRPLAQGLPAFDLVLISHRQPDSPAVQHYIDQLDGTAAKCGEGQAKLRPDGGG